MQDGVKTVWAQQYDHETLQPVKARAYELPALSAGESADITMLLMRIKNPSPEVVEAVESAAAWFDRTFQDRTIFHGKGSALAMILLVWVR